MRLTYQSWPFSVQIPPSEVLLLLFLAVKPRNVSKAFHPPLSSYLIPFLLLFLPVLFTLLFFSLLIGISQKEIFYFGFTYLLRLLRFLSSHLPRRTLKQCSLSGTPCKILSSNFKKNFQQPTCRSSRLHHTSPLFACTLAIDQQKKKNSSLFWIVTSLRIALA